MKRYRRPDVTAFFKNLEKDESKKSLINFDESGFNFQIDQKDLSAKKYRVGILIETSSGERHLYYPDKKLENKTP